MKPLKIRLKRKFRKLKYVCHQGVLPNYLIIGSQRCGTTSLYNYLISHPCVMPALRKEIHFFDKHFNKGLHWYRSHFPSHLYRYYSTKKHGLTLITGEASPYYLFHPLAAERIKGYIPNVKLIVLFRNPVDRAYSHYNLEKKLEKEELSFEKAVEFESQRLEGEIEKIIRDESYSSFHHQNHSYLSRGVYIKQLHQWLKLFPRKQFLILKSEEFFNDPAKVFNTVTKFLDIPSIDIGHFPIYNKIKCHNMNAATRKKLNNFFLPYNEQLKRLLKIDFGWK